ncbi:hypothetical protein BOTBODRAFT_127841 [Botryobasidium botryosum FD-172 SS1]|uniref:Elongation of fatty acids protein n=1 Tax=Botryobasidium botryosum (strain FD-172 SS1) TaxID=930990 RepID=A0A067MQD8_BOTB1|nr:hypothetical protein BOTBODRAFT_127841 [Botryobasidium botryosum FD-172 SS1]
MSLSDLLVASLPLQYIPSSLHSFQAGKTPLSTLPVVLPVLAGYVATVFTLREVMRNREPIRLNTLFRAHNAILTLGSGLLLALMLEDALPKTLNHGILYGMCGRSIWTPKMELYYLINYYFKYLELLDTVFIALRKKPLTFLHVYHHTATAFLCWVGLHEHISGAWLAITINLTVHVFMYYYYWATAGGQRIWWKRYLTQMQIGQFIVDLAFICYAVGYMLSNDFSFLAPFASRIWPALPYGQTGCAATYRSAAFAAPVATSYLLLFVRFYVQTYTKRRGIKGKSE